MQSFANCYNSSAVWSKFVIGIERIAWPPLYRITAFIEPNAEKIVLGYAPYLVELGLVFHSLHGHQSSGIEGCGAPTCRRHFASL